MDTCRVTGQSLDSFDIEVLRQAVERPLESIQPEFDTANDIVVIPDTHYPFHPSTGLVTNPDLIRAVLCELNALTNGCRLSIGCASADAESVDRIAQYLNYEGIANEFDADLIDLHAVRRVRHSQTTADTSCEVEMPQLMDDGTVINIPTLRIDSGKKPTTEMANLTRATDVSGNDSENLTFVSRLCSPVLTILDGTYTYTGHPHKSEFLLTAKDFGAIEESTRELLDINTRKTLNVHDSEPMNITYELVGTTVDELANSLPNSASDKSILSEDMMAKAYRLYARLSGDAVPPQFLNSGGS